MTDLTTDALCASGPVRALADENARLNAALLVLGAYLMEKGEAFRVGEGSELLDAYSAALTPARQVDAEHCGCGDKACLACFPAATPTAQEAAPACKHLRTTHSRPGYDPLRPVVITCDDCGAVLSPDAHPPQPSVSVAVAGEDLVRAMRLFWEADEAADECRATGKDLEAARYDKMATGRWQSIPEKIDALDAALRALKGGEA